MLCYWFHLKLCCPVVEKFLRCHTVQEFFFPLPKKNPTKNKNQKKPVLTSSLPPLHATAFVCLLSGHPSWVFLLQCFFQLTNSRFSSMGLMDWQIQAPCPHSLTRSLAHTRKHRKKQQSAFQLCGSGRPTDSTLSWWSKITFQSGQRWCFWGPHNYLVAAVVKRLKTCTMLSGHAGMKQTFLMCLYIWLIKSLKMVENVTQNCGFTCKLVYPFLQPAQQTLLMIGCKKGKNILISQQGESNNSIYVLKTNGQICLLFLLVFSFPNCQNTHQHC